VTGLTRSSSTPF